MANYPNELVDLVNEYLTDGIISSKERQVLLKKAVALGVDADEFDLYIDAQQQKVDQAVDAAASKKRGKTCPFCGGVVPQLSDKCPHCGENITAEASEELQEIFDHLEEALVDFKSGNDIAKSKAMVERYVRKAKMYYENNPKVQKLLLEVQQEGEKASETAKKNARTNTINSYLKKKGTWIVGEILIFGLLFAILTGMKSCANSEYEHYAGIQMSATSDGSSGLRKDSPEYWEIVSKKNDAYDRSESFNNYVVLILGFIVVGITAKIKV